MDLGDCHHIIESGRIVHVSNREGFRSAEAERDRYSALRS